MKNENMGKNNFGRKGWLMILLAGIAYFFFAGTVNDGLNIIVGNFSELHQLDYNQVLSSATPAAWFGILGVIVWTWVVKRIGSRITGALTMVLGAIAYAMYGIVSTVTGFMVVTAVVNFMAYGFCNTAAQVMIAHWFPTRKGLALGWATMGTNLSSAVFVPLLMLFIGFRGVNFSYFGVGILMLIAAVIYYALVRDMPEEYGCAPDNGALTAEEIKAAEKEIAEYKSPWTVGKLLKNKYVWLTSIGFGAFIMVTVALISQLIPRLTAAGWEQSKATSMMTVAAVLGLAGSYLTGWLDEKIGTKKASIIYGLWYLVAVILCVVPATDATMYLSVFFLGIGIGGIGNLLPSMISSLFNRYDFALALGVINVISLVMRSFTFSIMAFGLSNLGGYSGAYAIIAVINVIGIIAVALIKEEQLKL